MTGIISLRDMLGLNNRFSVKINDMDLGMWGSCKGLSVDFKPEPIKQGGVYDYQTILPGQVQYKAVTLRRAINPKDSKTVQDYLRKMMSDWVGAMKQTGAGGHADISLFSSEGVKLMTWTLHNVFPSRWDGPELDAMTAAGIAMETLELVHEGFL